MLLLLFVIVMFLASVLQAILGFGGTGQCGLGAIKPETSAAWTRKHRHVVSDESVHQGGSYEAGPVSY